MWNKASHPKVKTSTIHQSQRVQTKPQFYPPSGLQDWTQAVSFDFGLRGERASKGYQLSAWRDTTWETQTTETGFQLAVLRDKNGSKTRVAGFIRDLAGNNKKTVLGFFCKDPRHWLDLNVDLTVSAPFLKLMFWPY